MSLDSEDGALFLTTSRRLRQQVYGRICAIPHCEALAYSALECLDDPSWVKWSTTFGAIERRAIDCKTDVRTVRCQWQAFARVLQATRLALKLIRSEDLQAELVMTRTQFIDQFVLEGEIASSSFKALANMSLDASLSGSSDAEDHGLISRLGRAVETDPRIILSKEELSRSNAASLYADRPQEAFMKLVDDHVLRAQIDPFELFGREVLKLAWGIYRPSAPYQELLKEKDSLDESGRCVKNSPWCDKDGRVFRYAPSTHGGFGFTMKRTASMLFSRRMGGVAKEALMLVQASLGDNEPAPEYLQTILSSPQSKSGTVRDRLCKSLTEMRDFQLRLHCFVSRRCGRFWNTVNIAQSVANQLLEGVSGWLL